MHVPPSTTANPQIDTATGGPSSWKQRYGKIHGLQRIRDFPTGVAAPQTVRLYYRRDHYILQWWDPADKKTLSVRVSGDLIDAIAEARKIETQLANYKTASHGVRKLQHEDLVQEFSTDLKNRSDAGEIAAATVERYQTALKHYQSFVSDRKVRIPYPTVEKIDRNFRLQFAAWLAQNRKVTGSAATLDPGGIVQVLDTVRAMLNWANDPDRGDLLPDGFRNPFNGQNQSQRLVNPDPFGEPDITVGMATEFIAACDEYQLRLFGPVILYGLRAAEPIYLFREQLDEQWLRVNCLPQLDYLTKGQRDKRFPLVAPLTTLLKDYTNQPTGLLFTRRLAGSVAVKLPQFQKSLMALASEYDDRCRDAGNPSVVERQKIRNQLIQDAGGLNYDQIEHEFQVLARKLAWPRTATLKDFRHLFSTCLENAGVPEFYRRYFMGQSPGTAPIATYTHLNQLQEQFAKAQQTTLAPLVAALSARHDTLNRAVAAS